MTGLLALFLIGCFTVCLGTVEAAFSSLMRLSLRLMAERGGRSDRLGRYLDDPLQLFVPIRVLLGLCIILAGVFIARVSTVQDLQTGQLNALSVLSPDELREDRYQRFRKLGSFIA